MARLIPRPTLARQLLAAISLCLLCLFATVEATAGEIDFDYSDRKHQVFYFNWHDYREIPEGYVRFDASVRTFEDIHSELGYGFHHQNYRLRPGADEGIPREARSHRFTWGAMFYLTDIDHDRTALSMALAGSLHFRMGLDSPFFIGGGFEYTPNIFMLNGRERMAWSTEILLESLMPVHFYLRHQYILVHSRRFSSILLADNLAFGLRILF